MSRRSAAGLVAVAACLGASGCSAYCDGSELFAAAEAGEVVALDEVGDLGDPRIPSSALGVKPIREALPLLQPYLHADDPRTRLLALESVRRLAQRAPSLYRDRFPGLVSPLLLDPEPEIRWRTAWTLGRCKLTEPNLRLAALDADDRVAERALWALGQARDEEGIPALVHALERSDAVATQAMRSLRRTTGLLLQGIPAWRDWARERFGGDGTPPAQPDGESGQ